MREIQRLRLEQEAQARMAVPPDSALCRNPTLLAELRLLRYLRFDVT